MDQQTQDWHEWRSMGLGASDAPIIMKVSPWKTPYQLWEEKTKRVKRPYTGNFATDRGNRLEPIARATYELEQNCEAKAILVENEKFPFIRASLDGYDAEKGIVLEIKCPGRADHETALNGGVPDKYYPQIQHQLLACPAAKLAHYYSYDGERGTLVVVPPDLEYQKKLFDELCAFWLCIQNDTPPEPMDRDFSMVDSEVLGGLLEVLDSKTKQYKAIEKEIEDLRRSVYESVDNKRVLINNRWRVNVCYRKGSIDYSGIPELLGVNLERYRKSGSVYKTITEIKK